jgi:hypothetical protein
MNGNNKPTVISLYDYTRAINCKFLDIKWLKEEAPRKKHR